MFSPPTPTLQGGLSGNPWRPLDAYSVSAEDGKTAKSVSFERKTGGELVEIGHDGKRRLWGSVTRYEPGKRLTFSWRIMVPASEAARVDITSTPLGEGRAQVDIVHRG